MKGGCKISCIILEWTGFRIQDSGENENVNVNKNTAFSIIIPHKNIPDLLIRCVNSIPKRDDLEIIIIDDNSSPEIVNFENFPFKNDDSRNLKIIFDKSNKGAGHARNLGLEVARGKWVIFADADDFFLFTFNNILDKYKNSDYDLIFCNACSLDSEFYTNAHRTENYISAFIKDYLSTEHHEQGELMLKYGMGVPWCKVTRKKVIEDHKIKFDETFLINDCTFSYLIAYYAKTIFVESVAIYCWTDRDGSLITVDTDETNLTRIEVYAKRRKFLNSHNVKFKTVDWGIYLYRMRLKNKDIYKKGYEILINLGFTPNEIKSELRKISRQNFKASAKRKIKKLAKILFFKPLKLILRPFGF